jgi:hypothetical protein
MRSTLSLERTLATISAALLEASWLTLAYLLIQWLSGGRNLHLGLVTFAAAAAAGLLLARAVRKWDRSRFAAVVVGATIAAAAAGMLLFGPPNAHAGGWLLGLAVWRGSLHAELGDEAEISESVLRAGIVGLIGFWIVATASQMVASVAFTAPAFVATIAFIGSGLLSVGLARLANLEIEQMDRGARRRWVTLLLTISGLVLLLAVPIAALLGVPLAESIEAVAGPLAPFLIQAILLLAIPLALLTDLLAGLISALFRPRSEIPLPTLAPVPTASAAPPTDVPAGVLDLSWLGLIGVLAVAAVALMIVAALARPPGTPRRSRSVDEERHAEPIAFDIKLSLPRMRMPRLRTPRPRSAVDAYRYALAALADSPDARLPTETPREHAHRVGPGHAADMRRLAADYQLVSFAGADLTAAEERRAVIRWRRVVQRARRTTRTKPKSTKRASSD